MRSFAVSEMKCRPESAIELLRRSATWQELAEGKSDQPRPLRYPHARGLLGQAARVLDVVECRGSAKKGAYTLQLFEIIPKGICGMGRELFLEHVLEAYGFVESSCALIWFIGNCRLQRRYEKISRASGASGFNGCFDECPTYA